MHISIRSSDVLLRGRKYYPLGTNLFNLENKDAFDTRLSPFHVFFHMMRFCFISNDANIQKASIEYHFLSTKCLLMCNFFLSKSACMRDKPGLSLAIAKVPFDINIALAIILFRDSCQGLSNYLIKGSVSQRAGHFAASTAKKGR